MLTNHGLNLYLPGLPWWRSGWESACQCRGHGFEPWSGRIPHAAERLGPWATTTEPACLESVLRSGRGRDSERPAHRDEEWPPLAATGEGPCTGTKTQHSQKIKINLKIKKKNLYLPNDQSSWESFHVYWPFGYPLLWNFYFNINIIILIFFKPIKVPFFLLLRRWNTDRLSFKN